MILLIHLLPDGLMNQAIGRICIPRRRLFSIAERLGSRKANQGQSCRYFVWAFCLAIPFALLSAGPVFSQDLVLDQEHEAVMANHYESLLGLRRLFDIVQLQEECVSKLGSWPFPVIFHEQKRPLAIDCAGYWAHLGQTVAKKNRRSVQEAYSEFFGFLHGRVGVSPPAEWRYYLLNGKMGDVERRQNRLSTTLKPEETVEFLLETKRLRFNGGSMFIRGFAEIGAADASNSGWRCDLLVMNALPRGTMLSGSSNYTEWVEITKASLDGPIIIWGIDNSGYCYVYIIDQQTGKLNDFLILPAINKH